MEADKINFWLAVIVFVILSVCSIYFSKQNILLEKQLEQTQQELKQAKAQIKVLEENQVIVYYADSWGGE
jgi:membrane protein implicated in regulation of membrane protease activity